MMESSSVVAVKDNKLMKGVFAVSGIMVTLVIYGLLQREKLHLVISETGMVMSTVIWVLIVIFFYVQHMEFCGERRVERLYVNLINLSGVPVQEKIMRVPYGQNKEFFKYSLFLVFCNRLMTSAVSAGALLASKKALDPVAPVYKYCLVSVTNILTTTCQYEALKYVSFPVQTLAKCAKMIPVMVWGTLIMQKRYKGLDYLWAVLVTVGCSVFILYPAADDISPYSNGKESSVWGVSLMVGYLGFDGFTSTFQDKLFKGYNMEIHNQIFYTTLCSCVLSLTASEHSTLMLVVCASPKSISNGWSSKILHFQNF
ncbi:hypothetical protein KSS87_011026 [Heliosperma pusillum]|nr:hypothetical protein KSS87_011026 [Heliosperma pusillum]